MPTGLIPRQITVGSDFKAFTKSDPIGLSDGSSVSITFDVDPNLNDVELSRLVFIEKEKLDLATLTMEYAKGSITDTLFQHRKARIRGTYDKILKRGPEQTGGDQPAA
jgi:hypothetical protein